MQTDRDTVIPGGTVQVCGDGWLPGAQVELSLDGETPLGTATAGEDGSFCADVVVPSGTVEGIYEVMATGLDGDGSPASQVEDLTVELPATDVVKPIVRTGDHGAPMAPLFPILLGLAALGLVFRPAREDS